MLIEAPPGNEISRGSDTPANFKDYFRLPINNRSSNPAQETIVQAAARLMALMNSRRRENARLDRLIVEREARAEAEREERWERRHWVYTGNVIDLEVARCERGLT